MAERSPLEILLEDPLSEVTRKERRSLLAASVLGLIVVYAGLIPTRISALGIEFTPSEKTVLLKAFAAVVSYFLLVFIFYVIPDILAWRARFRDAVRDRYQTLGSEPEDIPYPRRVFASPANFFSALRTVFDSILTLLPGVWAAWVLLRSRTADPAIGIEGAWRERGLSHRPAVRPRPCRRVLSPLSLLP